MHRKGTNGFTPFLSIVIPVFNEEKRIPKTLQRISDYMHAKGHSSEIIVVNDGSSDKSTDIVQNISMERDTIRLLENDSNRGKGYSVKKGMMEARGRYIFFSDADLSTPIEETEHFLHWMENGYDIVVGSRALKESEVKVRQPLFREYMGKTFNKLVKLVTHINIHDTQCGFKCFRREAVREILSRQRVDRFSFDVELIFIAKKLGYKVKELPVRWFNNPFSRVNPFFDSVRMFFDLLKIRYYDARGYYR